MINSQGKLWNILYEYVLDRTQYYRQQFASPVISPKKIIQESYQNNELPIVKILIENEFPEHKDYLYTLFIIK